MLARKISLPAFPLCLMLTALPACAQQDEQVRMNEIQVVGTHNSYHAGVAPSKSKLWQQKNPHFYPSLDYRHAAHRAAHRRRATD